MRNPNFHLLKTAWKHVEGRRFLFVLTYVLFIIANVIAMMEPLVLAKMVNVIQQGGPDVFARATLWLVLFASLTLFFWLFHGPARNLERVNSFHITCSFIVSLYRIVNQLPMRWHRDHHTGETYDKIAKGKRGIEGFTSYAARNIECGIQFSVALIAILFFLPVYGLIAAAIGCIAIAVMLRFDKALAKTIDETNKQEHAVASALFDYVSNITTVITLRLERLTENEIAKRITRVFPPFRRQVSINEWKYFSVNSFMTLIRFTVMFLYLFEKVRGNEAIMIGSLIALYQYTERLSWSYFNMANLHEEVVTQSANLHAVDSILDTHKAFGSAQPRPKPIGKWKAIDIKGLTFRYEDTDHRVHHIDSLDLTIKSGRRIALVGASGSGKSTLMNLLRGTEDAKTATVTIDDRGERDLRVLAGITTLIPQDPEIFENTIAYNITAGLKFEPSEVRKAVRIARFEEVVKRLPKGLESNIKEKGVNLSGGEKQRLALARGIFAAKDSDVILLDEPTSSVDTANELEIHKNLFAHFKDRTIISSIHRLHLLPLFDEIYVLERGKVAQRGTFEELTKKEGALKTMWANYVQKRSRDAA